MHLLRIYISQNRKKVNWSTEPELKPIMKINLKNAACSQHMYENSFWRIGCIWWFVSPFCDPCCLGYTPNHLIMRRREKKLWNWATTSPCWRLDQGVLSYRSYTIVSGAVGHGCWPLYLWNWEKISKIWEKQKQLKRETGLGFALSCTRSFWFILFYFIVDLLFIYLFFYLSIFSFFIHLLWTAV